MISFIWESLMPSHQRRSSSLSWGRVGETRAERQDHGRPASLSSRRPGKHRASEEVHRSREHLYSARILPGNLVSKQFSCLLARGVQERSKDVGWRLTMPAKAWLLRGLQRLTSMWFHRRLSQVLQKTAKEETLDEV